MQLLTTAQAAASLAVCTATVLRLARRGELPAVRVGGALRFDVADLERYVERHKGRTPALYVVGPGKVNPRWRGRTSA